MNTAVSTSSVVAVYPTHTAAEAAVKALQTSGFDMKQLSIVGRDHHLDEHVVGYYNVGDRMKLWAGSFVLVARSNAEQAEHARDIQAFTPVTALDHHALAAQA